MSFNKKELKVDNAKAPKKPKDIIYDPMGQWKYPGQITKIPSNHITMKGVNYPVLGVDDEGNEQIMLPGYDYVYPGNDVTEYPILQYGGSRPISADKALAFLETGSIRGKALSDRQLEYFAQVAGVELDEEGNIVNLDKDDDEHLEFKKGGWLDKYHSLPRRTTSKNIKTSINPLFTRNYTIYGPPGRRLYKPKLQDGGENYLEGDLISKVLVERNKDKDFIKRAMYPNRTIQYNPDMSISTHLMEWGEDESGQAFMYPSIFNPNNEVVKVPNQYADYISSKGYKKATGMNEYQQGGWLEEFQGGGDKKLQYQWSNQQPLPNKLETPTSNYKQEAEEAERQRRLELERQRQLEASKEVQRIAGIINQVKEPVYNTQTSEDVGTINYGRTDLRRKDSIDPRNAWMYPQLSDEGNRSMGDFSLGVVGAALPIPGLESMGKIPGVGKPVKKLLENVPDRTYSFFKPSEYSKIDWGKEWFSKIEAKQEELLKLYNSGKIDWVKFNDLNKTYKTTLAKELGLGNQIGRGAYGEVYETINDPSTLIKLGDNFRGRWTPELIKKSKPINIHKNIAVPDRAEYYDIPYHNSSNTMTKEVLFMPNLNKTISKKLGLDRRDAYAMFLKQTRKLRDAGIEVDAHNLSNFKFNKDKGIFDIYDINPNPTSSYYMNWVKDQTKHMLQKKGGQINWLENY